MPTTRECTTTSSENFTIINIDKAHIINYDMYSLYIMIEEKMMDTKKKPMQIYLREDQVETLRTVAERRGESIAALVRQGVDMLLESLPAGEDPILDIVGLYDSGRGDLAEKHDEYLAGIVNAESRREP